MMFKQNTPALSCDIAGVNNCELLIKKLFTPSLSSLTPYLLLNYCRGIIFSFVRILHFAGLQSMGYSKRGHQELTAP